MFWLKARTFWLKASTFWLKARTFWLKARTFWLKARTVWFRTRTGSFRVPAAFFLYAVNNSAHRQVPPNEGAICPFSPRSAHLASMANGAGGAAYSAEQLMAALCRFHDNIGRFNNDETPRLRIVPGGRIMPGVYAFYQFVVFYRLIRKTPAALTAQAQV
jgi:hypothetical protein